MRPNWQDGTAEMGSFYDSDALSRINWDAGIRFGEGQD